MVDQEFDATSEEKQDTLQDRMAFALWALTQPQSVALMIRDFIPEYHDMDVEDIKKGIENIDVKVDRVPIPSHLGEGSWCFCIEVIWQDLQGNRCLLHLHI